MGILSDYIYETTWGPGLVGDLLKNRLLVVVDAVDLRGQKDEINHLSWDRTVEDVCGKTVDGVWDYEITYRFHLVIRFGFEGAIYKGPGECDRPLLIYEPGNALKTISSGPTWIPNAKT